MMVRMPRFQSRLFNWIDSSLPAQLGRSVRRSLDQKIRQLAGLPLQELPRLLAYQVAKAALYPVYLIASTAKRIFPALERSKAEPKEKLRSQPDAVGLLSEFDNLEVSPEIDQSLNQFLEPKIDLPKPEVPLLLRPLAKFFDWLDRTKTQLDRNIAAIVKRQTDYLATSDNPELEPKLNANRIFAEIWQQQIAQAERNTLKENNGLAENVSLGKNRRLEQLRRLIEAAIAYFFGNQSPSPEPSLANNEERSEIFGTESPDAKALPDSPKLRRRRVTSANAKTLKKNAPLAESNKLDRLRDLIAAAIDYFIGKRSLDGDQDKVGSINGTQPDLLAERLINQLQSRTSSYPNRGSKQELNQDSEFSDALKVDYQLDRLQRLIAEAIAYFFGKQRSPTLEETSDITPSDKAWLTMEDVFGDDNGPWPMPLEYESIAFSKSPDRITIHSSGELENFETTTTQISQDQLDGSLVFEEELLIYQQQSFETDSDRPLRAWIENKANIGGRSNNPLIRFLLWLDEIVLKIEDLLIKFWKGLMRFPKRLINFMRFGKKR